MTAPVILHPSVRERREPRVSATTLAEYLILKAEAQDDALHDARFAIPPPVTAYANAMRALRAYNLDPNRDKKTIRRVKELLAERAADETLKPRIRAEALRCIEVLDLFEVAENALGLRALPLIVAPRFAPLKVEGVAVSVQPHFLVEAGDAKKPRWGAVMLRLAKTPDPASVKTLPKREAKGEERREMARYMAAMTEMVLKDQVQGKVDRSLVFVADIRLGERIDAANDFAARQKSIKAACGQIVRLWPTIQPKQSLRRTGT